MLTYPIKCVLWLYEPNLFDEDTGKQLVRLPNHWMTVPARLKVGTHIRLINHIALRLGTRGPEFKDWDQVVKILETHNGRGQFPPKDITQPDDEDTVWAGLIETWGRFPSEEIEIQNES